MNIGKCPRIGEVLKKPQLAALTFLLLYIAFLPRAEPALFGPKGDSTGEKRGNVRKQRDEVLQDLYTSNPKLKSVISGAEGYATFKATDMHLLLLASSNGYGVLVDNRSGQETFMRVASLGGGVGMGVKDIRVAFIFHDRKIMKQFVEQGWQFNAKADAAAKYEDTGVSAEQNVKGSVDFKEGTVASGSASDVSAQGPKIEKSGARGATRGGMEIYQFTESGVALQATVAGTKYWKDSKLN
jgi:lipid-binding SYLF domain-containing protein